MLNGVQVALDLVYIDICGPFHTASWNGHEYFITFTDNNSRYGYLYCYMINPNYWICLKSIKLKLKIN